MKYRKIRTTILLAIILIFSFSLVSCTKNVTDEEISVKFQEKDYEGKYTGVFESNKANGEGTFEYKDGDDYLTYEGNFKDGQFNDNGTLKTNLLKVDLTEVTRTGEYEGDVVNGVPNGEGEFTAVNDEGKKYTYTGEWKDGTWDGQGSRSFEEKDYHCKEEGNFENGEFKPTILQNYIALGTVEPKYVPTEKAKNFLTTHENLFPTKNKKKAEKYTKNNLQYKHVNKNPDNYGDQLIKLTNYEVTQIWEVDSWDGKLTEITAMSSNYDNVICVLYLGKVKLYEGDKFTVYGLPLDDTSWTNVGGGTTLAITLAGSYIEKQ